MFVCFGVIFVTFSQLFLLRIKGGRGREIAHSTIIIKGRKCLLVLYKSRIKLQLENHCPNGHVKCFHEDISITFAEINVQKSPKTYEKDQKSHIIKLK